MAIKIIKDGEMTKFKKTCPDCGCEFEYEASDLSADYSVCLTTYPPKYNTYVVCPCCGKRIHHGMTEAAGLTIASSKIYYTDTQYAHDCDECQNRPDPSKIAVGDTPCTWCEKRQPHCVSDGIVCASAGASYTVDPKDLWATTRTTGSYGISDFTVDCTTTR